MYRSLGIWLKDWDELTFCHLWIVVFDVRSMAVFHTKPLSHLWCWLTFHSDQYLLSYVWPQSIFTWFFWSDKFSVLPMQLVMSFNTKTICHCRSLHHWGQPWVDWFKGTKSELNRWLVLSVFQCVSRIHVTHTLWLDRIVTSHVKRHDRLQVWTTAMDLTSKATIHKWQNVNSSQSFNHIPNDLYIYS